MLLASWLLLPVGFVLEISGIAAAVPRLAAGGADLGKTVLGIALGLLGVAVILLSRYLRREGKRRLSPITTVEEVLAGPPFVLYLRSFTDDVQLARTSPNLSGFGLFTYRAIAAQGVRTEEEQLRVAVIPFGSMVAVGTPGELLPEIGARRLYLPHTSWQDSVLRMMAEAGRTGLVLMGAGLSDSLRWEFGLAVRTVPPQRLVLIIALNSQEHDEFRQGPGQVFPSPLPEYPQLPTNPNYRAKIRGAIYFDAGWTSHFVRFDTRQSFGNHQRVIESKFVYGLRPVYDRLGVKWPGFEHQTPVYRRFTRRQIPFATFRLASMIAVPILVVLVIWILTRLNSLGTR